MNVPRKIIFPLLVAFSLCGVLATSAGAVVQPTLVEVSVLDPYCAPDSTVTYVAQITNVYSQSINVQAVDEYDHEHHVVELPSGQTVSFEFATEQYQTDAAQFEIFAAIPFHEDEDGSVQVLQAPHAGLDCRNAHEPTDTPTTTLPVTSTTSSVPQAVPSTTTTMVELQPEAYIADAAVQTREFPTATQPTAVSANELAYTGTKWIGTELKVVLTLLVLGCYALYFSRNLRKKERIKRRKRAIAAARKG